VADVIVFVGLMWLALKSNVITVAILRNLGQYLVWFYLGICMQNLSDFLTKWSHYYYICTVLFACVLLFSVITLGRYNELMTFALLIAGYLAIPNKTNSVTAFLSKNSFGIYLLHSPLIYITFTFWKDENPVFVVAMNLVVFGGIACVLASLIVKTPMKFIVGIYPKKVAQSAVSKEC
jgi:peptidoglycan/LPS O-acetylase OafA/YrhL